VINLEKYKNTFIKSLDIKESDFKESIQYNEVPEWDSIGHMTLISALEETFDISFETDDIVDFSSFEKGKELLGKYKVNF
tara:strand:+ start:494 stop:733 length:240 start_codon:yes stop_codon:yes gene_type:complete